ncbi:hypothetical protein [Moorena sp. SIO4G3]|uniref:hypothetical protein n=1 Tax=Moorena sp. SIO4G3 TaxID=2607821 RepID=UPI00142BAE4D|nr:hypothetical protein [Moorena sp. SIO4G3]NEO81867.1 hypothetical protein [Moorena sp. SIO4G3]
MVFIYSKESTISRFFLITIKYTFLQFYTSRFPIPDSRFPISDSRFPVPDSRFPVPCSLLPTPSNPEICTSPN